MNFCEGAIFDFVVDDFAEVAALSVKDPFTRDPIPAPVFADAARRLLDTVVDASGALVHRGCHIEMPPKATVVYKPEYVKSQVFSRVIFPTTLLFGVSRKDAELRELYNASNATDSDPGDYLDFINSGSWQHLQVAAVVVPAVGGEQLQGDTCECACVDAKFWHVV